jgi:hypothetical protein
MRRTDPDQHKFAVYLIDPGPRGTGVISLLQEVTGASTGNCAQMVRASPTFVTTCRTRAAAEDLVARFKEFDAIAVVRPIGRPLRERSEPSLLGEATPGLIPIALILLALAQIAVALWWARGGNVLGAVGGGVLAVIVLIASIALFRRRL